MALPVITISPSNPVANGQIVSTDNPLPVYVTGTVDMTVGTSTIAGGTTGRVLYDNAGVLGEMTTTGSGTVLVLATGGVIAAPTITKSNYAADAGSTDSYAITLSPALGAYTAGLEINFKANTANTGAASIDVNGLGAKTIVKAVSTTLANNDILANMICKIVYDGTNFVLMNPRAL